MSTDDRDDLIREAEEKLAEANAEVQRLRDQLAEEKKDAERVLTTAEDGRAEARRRYPRKDAQNGTGNAQGSADSQPTGAAAGIAAARARGYGR